MDDERCEVVLYTPDHDATLWSLGPVGVRKVVDLWAERTAALGARPDVAYVLVFENRGAEVGATIPHPHGQIYAYDECRPGRPACSRRLAPGPRPGASGRSPSPGVGAPGCRRRRCSRSPSRRCPDEPLADLPGCGDAARDELAGPAGRRAGPARPSVRPADAVHAVVQPAAGRRLDRGRRLSLEVVSPWRAAGVARYIAAAEVAAEEYFNPVVPEELAARLRALSVMT